MAAAARAAESRAVEAGLLKRWRLLHDDVDGPHRCDGADQREDHDVRVLEVLEVLEAALESELRPVSKPQSDEREIFSNTKQICVIG